MSYFLLDKIPFNVEDFSLEKLEQNKNTEILKVALTCVDGMISILNDKKEQYNDIVESMQQTKQEIEYWLNIGKVTTQTVILIVKKVIEYKETLEFLGMFLSALVPFFPLFHLLTMFIL